MFTRALSNSIYRKEPHFTKGDEQNGQKSGYCGFSCGGERRKAKRGDREGYHGGALKGTDENSVDEGSGEGHGYKDLTNRLSSAFPLFV